MRRLTALATTAALTLGIAAHTATTTDDYADAATGAAASGARTGPVEIMLAGDSITQGFSGIPSYRYWLWRELKRQGVSFDLVGPRDGMGAPSHHLHHFDHDHDAVIGTQLATRRRTIGRQVATYEPDVLVVMLGHNDMRHGVSGKATAGYMRDYLHNALAANPHMRVVVCEVMDAYFRTGRQRFPGENTTFNRRLRAIAADFSTAEHPVTVADTQYSGWHPRHGDTKDGTHPTPTGGTKVAQRIGWALHRRSMGRILPERPRILAGHRPWNPNPIVTLVPKPRKGRLLVRWQPEVEALSITNARVQYRDLTTGRTRWTRWGYRHGYASLPGMKPHHRYRVRLQPRNSWMTGMLGAAAYVTFPRS